MTCISTFSSPKRSILSSLQAPLLGRRSRRQTMKQNNRAVEIVFFFKEVVTKMMSRCKKGMMEEVEKSKTSARIQINPKPKHILIAKLCIKKHPINVFFKIKAPLFNLPPPIWWHLRVPLLLHGFHSHLLLFLFSLHKTQMPRSATGCCYITPPENYTRDRVGTEKIMVFPRPVESPLPENPSSGSNP